MGSKMLIDASQPEETRVVVARGNKLEEFDFESASRKPLKGNIYLAKVTRVEPSLQAAFVEYGGNRHGFLAFAEIHPDYYQIPIADRMALLAEQEADEAEEDDDHTEQSDGETHADDNADAGESMALDGEREASLTSEPVDHNDRYHGEQAHQPAEGNNDERPAPDASPNGDVVDVGGDAEAQKVETIGEEDALEEVPHRQRRQQRRKHYKIQEVIKRRQILLVQVIKEERGNKGAALTTYLSLAGRYCVLMPNTARGGGISRKISDNNDRRRLKELAKEIEVPKGMGVIVRTAGAQRTKPEIKRDFDYLMRLWENVRELTLQSEAPCLVYEEGNLIKRSIRDLYTKDVDEVIVDGDAAYREAKDFMKMLMPSHAKNVKAYKDSKPLFQRHQVEAPLDALFSPTVNLPSGGYIVINQTEALVSIDINSGKATREHNIEDTASKTNLEACDEIGRQLRLRDLAGLVVIDFIDMEENRNNRAVERRMKDALKNDRARIQVGRISHFGLLEMSRQRLRPGLIEGTFKPCPHCEGRGIVRSIPSCGLGVLRQIEEYLQKGRNDNLTVKCAREVAFYLLNEKRDSLLELEQTFGISIFLVPGGEDVRGTQATIERAPDREKIKRRVTAVPVQMESGFSTASEAEEPASEVVIEDDAAEQGEEVTPDDASDASANGDLREPRDGTRRRKRRGRRGGRRDEVRSDNGGDAPIGEGESSDTWAEPVAADADESAGTEDTSAGQGGVADGDAGNAGDGEQNQERRGRRRGRFGRTRERQSERPDGSDARPAQAPRAERENRPRRERPVREPQTFVAPPEPVVIHIPDVIPDPEPRKWQPPAPTIAVEPTERKGGWWSKR